MVQPTDPIYSHPVSLLLTAESPSHRRAGWLDYTAWGISAEHQAELLRMSLDRQLHQAPGDTSLVFAPVHAWRALGQVGTLTVLGPLLELLVEDEDDEWARQDLPQVFAMIGSAALPELIAFVQNPEKPSGARASAAEGLTKIALAEPERRAEVVSALSTQLARWYRNDETLNSLLIGSLLDLQATEAAGVIEEAFEGERVDLLVNGDWEDVQIELGLLTERVTPPRGAWQGFDLLPPPGVRSAAPKAAKEDATARKKKKQKAARVARKGNRRRK